MDLCICFPDSTKADFPSDASLFSHSIKILSKSQDEPCILVTFDFFSFAAQLAKKFKEQKFPSSTLKNLVRMSLLSMEDLNKHVWWKAVTADLTELLSWSGDERWGRGRWSELHQSTLYRKCSHCCPGFVYRQFRFLASSYRSLWSVHCKNSQKFFTQLAQFLLMS